MRLTTIPSQIRPPRSEDWIVDGVKVGTICTTEAGNCCATVSIDEPRLNLTCWVIGIGPTREDAAADCLRKLSMCSLHVSQTYTKIVAAVQS